MECLKSFQKLGVDFLYRNYKKNFKGSILNGEMSMHLQLQVVMFLQLLFNKENVFSKFYVLILCPDDCLSYWHYHLLNNCKFNVKILSEDNVLDENDPSPSIYLLKFSLLKLCLELYDFEYFIVIVDRFDEISLSRPYRKLCGEYKIGLTVRNFYMDPNPKLQFNMLNWAQPGCVGKASSFHADPDVFSNVRDNFRHFWCRITWDFCDSLEKEENNIYEKEIKSWSIKHGFTADYEEPVDVQKKPRKRAAVKEIRSVRTKTPKIDYKPLPTMDETPILTSIINNFNSIPGPERPIESNFVLASTSKAFNEEIGDGDFLKSFILSKPPNTDAMRSLSADRFTNADIEMLLKETDDFSSN